LDQVTQLLVVSKKVSVSLYATFTLTQAVFAGWQGKRITNFTEHNQHTNQSKINAEIHSQNGSLE
jgi:hypothetical protein